MVGKNIARGDDQRRGSDGSVKDRSPELTQIRASNREFTRIIKKAMKGEYAAFEHLYKRYIKEIIYHARNLLIAPEDAEDAAQEVIIALYRNLKSLKSPYAFKSYLLKTIYTICVTRNRVTKQPAEQIEDYEEMLEDTTELGPQGSLEQMELSRAIRKVLVELPPKQREALSLRYFDDLEYEEIAELQNVTVSTVGSNILRAKKTLKYLIENDKTIDFQGEYRELSEESKNTAMDTPGSEDVKATDESEDPQTLKGTAAAPAICFAVAQLIEDSVTSESVEKVAKGVAAMLAGGGTAAGVGVGMTIKTKLLIAVISATAVVGSSAVAYEVHRMVTTNTVLETTVNTEINESIAEEFKPAAQIIFYGGNIASENTDGVIEHINPTSAELVLDEGEAVEWEIVDTSNTAIAQGQGDAVSEAVFVELTPGTYTLGWVAVNEEGSKAIITRDFSIH